MVFNNSPMKYFILIILSLFFFSFLAFLNIKQDFTQKEKIKSKNMFKIRPAYVAGQFYPGNALELKNKIKNYLNEAEIDLPTKATPRAIMVPHAGYEFSGAVAAYSYKTLQNKNIKRVFLLGNSHKAYFDGIAIDNNDFWQTPLGRVSVDLICAKKLSSLSDKIFLNSEAHIGDHILEVQIPFLQIVLGDNFKIIPMVFGNKNREDYNELIKVLKEIWQEGDLLVVGSDLSHYPAYNDANQIDKESLKYIFNKDVAGLERYIARIETERIPNEETLMCGPDSIKTMMALAKEFNWQGKILKYANSGDSLIGDEDRVVGYGALVFWEEKTCIQKLNQEQRKTLLNIAKESVENYIKYGKVPNFEINDPELSKQQGAFVTLHKDGKLRGCIGRILPGQEPLWQVVRGMAIAAATEDNRFLPVGESELSDLDYEISVLSVPKEIDDWQEIELGKDGVIIQKGFHSGVFLPQVADETAWSKEEFLAHLCADKAGLSPNCFKDDDVVIKIFQAEVFS